MSIKAHGKSLERKVVRGSKTVGRDVRSGATRVRARISKDAKIAGRDVERAGKRVKLATRSGVARISNRVKRARHAKSG